MKMISWNVNGIRACLGKGFMDAFASLDSDFFCLQETKCQEGQVKLDLPGYEQVWHSAEKKGYSGTAIFAKQKPVSVRLKWASGFWAAPFIACRKSWRSPWSIPRRANVCRG